MLLLAMFLPAIFLPAMFSLAYVGADCSAVRVWHAQARPVISGPCPKVLPVLWHRQCTSARVRDLASALLASGVGNAPLTADFIAPAPRNRVHCCARA